MASLVEPALVYVNDPFACLKQRYYVLRVLLAKYKTALCVALNGYYVNFTIAHCQVISHYFSNLPVAYLKLRLIRHFGFHLLGIDDWLVCFEKGLDRILDSISL